MTPRSPPPREIQSERTEGSGRGLVRYRRLEELPHGTDDADRVPFDDEAYNAWLSEMQLRYQLIGHDTYPFPRCDRRDRVVSVDFIDVLTFRQGHSGDAAPAMAIRDATTARAGVEGTERIHCGTSADAVIR